ncbi:Endophilin-A [Globodera pallida]|nr:Endophilin-A [Globodera pallida]
MSLSALKKQFNKANQYLSESVGAAEATKLDEEFTEMERKVDMTNELITHIINGTNEYLQPNPATRAKIAAMGAMSKVRGSTKNQSYPQTEGMLADTVQKFGRGLGHQSDFGKALCDAADAFRQMADVKYQLEDNVKHNFLDPISDFQNNELKDFNAHRNKLKSRRLDYDAKKRKQTKEDELVQAEEKLEESKQLTEKAMYNILNNDVEQITQLKALVEAQLDFHQQTLQILENLKSQLASRVDESNVKQRVEHTPKPVIDRRRNSRSDLNSIHSTTDPGRNSLAGLSISSPMPSANATMNSHGGPSPAHNTTTLSSSDQNAPSTAAQPGQKGKSKALYDFQALNPGELDFKEGQLIQLDSQIDEHWFEGTLDGRTGFFPISYVEIIVPIPSSTATQQ